MEARIEIEQEHVDHAARIARWVARSSVQGQRCGEDELEAEAIAVLWDLALDWDPDLGVPFHAFLTQRMKFRLVDHLRTLYGRPGSRKNSTIVASLDALIDAENDEGRPLEAPVLLDPGPSMEEIAESRQQLRRLGEFLRSGVLTELEIDCLLWPVTTGSPPKGRSNGGRRTRAKAQACEAIGRQIYIRKYTGESRTARYEREQRESAKS